jgi:cytochrome c biogenesis protein CcmG/thiol:disulfide interchange protein DsbE
MRRLKLFLPLAAFAVLAVFLFRGLSLDPTALPSARLGDPLPDFQLPALTSEVQLNNASLRGKPYLLNVWATWCYSCRVEHPYLLQLAEQGVDIIGLNYKDDSSKAIDWLNQLGDPYRETIVDEAGTLGLDLGVYGAPETYVVDAEGVVRYRHVGVVNERVWREDLARFFEAGP